MSASSLKNIVCAVCDEQCTHYQDIPIQELPNRHLLSSSNFPRVPDEYNCDSCILVTEGIHDGIATCFKILRLLYHTVLLQLANTAIQICSKLKLTYVCVATYCSQYEYMFLTIYGMLCIIEMRSVCHDWLYIINTVFNNKYCIL